VADLALIETALRNAHAAGDTDAARKLAAAYQAEKARQIEPSFEEKVAAQQEQDRIAYDPTAGMSANELRSAKYTKGALESARGVRQLLNKMTGDDEELASLNAQESDIRRRDAPLEARSEGDYFEVAGKVLPMVAATALAAKAAPLVIPSAIKSAVKAPAILSKPVISALAALGINMGAGGLSGASGALTEEEEAAGNRSTDAAIGTALGIIPAAGQLGFRGAKEIYRRATRALPEEEVAKFAANNLGATSRTAAIDKLRELVGGKVGELKSAASTAYNAAENNPALRPVDLSGAREVLGGAGDTLTGDITLKLNPQVGKVIAGLTGKAEDAVSFGDVRESQRILKAKMRKLDPSSEAYQAYSGTHDLLDQQLSKWANQADVPSPQNLLGDAPELSLEAKHLGLARQADEAYRRDVVPFMNRKKVLGQVYGGGEFPMGAENKLLHPSAGAEVRDIIERVPEMEGVMKKLYGANVLDQTSTSGMANALNKPAIDQILTNEERVMADKLVKALRERTGSTDLLGINSMLKQIGGLDRFRYGMDSLDYVPANSKLMPSVYGGIAAGELSN
jgi:hypothetical protein